MTGFIFSGSKITADGDSSHEIKRCLLLGRKAIIKLRQHIKKQRHSSAKGPYNQSYGFSSSHVWMWDLDHKEGWVLQNWCFWTVVLEKTLESPLDCKEIKPVNPKGNQSLIFIGRTDAEAEAPILWSPVVKSWLVRKYRDARKNWRQEKKGMTEDMMVGWHHWLNGHESEQDLGNLACCSPLCRKEMDMTERLSNKNRVRNDVKICKYNWAQRAYSKMI